MRGLLFLLSALFLLEATKGTEYDELDDHDRKIVDKAIKQGNMDHGKDKHLDYHTIIKRGNYMVNVILRPTSCDRITESVHRKECKTEDTKPQVSCIDCNETMKPCLLLIQKEEIRKRSEECTPSVNTKQTHYAGAAHAIYRKGENKQQNSGCLGCI